MINLLPDDKKQEIRAARANVILLRYNILILAAIGLLVVFCITFYLLLLNTQVTAKNTASENAAKEQQVAEVRKNVDEYKNNLKIASQILNNSVNYSSFFFRLTEILPEGTVVDSITFDSQSFNQQTTFTARASSFAKATELKDKLQKSDLFSNVYFQTLVNDNQTAGKNSYPIVATISAKVNKDIKP